MPPGKLSRRYFTTTGTGEEPLFLVFGGSCFLSFFLAFLAFLAGCFGRLLGAGGVSG